MGTNNGKDNFFKHGGIKNGDFDVSQLPKYIILPPIIQATKLCVVLHESPSSGHEAAHNSHGTATLKWVRRHPMFECTEREVVLGLEG